MEKTRDLFKKTRDTKGTIMQRWAQQWTETVCNWKKQKMLRRGGKNTQNYTKKIFMTQITMMMWSLT